MQDRPGGIAGPVPARSGPATSPGGTGDASVDVALQRLATLGARPVAEHVGEYEAVHRALQDALAALDQG